MNKATSVAYIDLLTVLFVFFFTLFAIVYANQKKQDAIVGNSVSKAEFLITLDWPDKSYNDFDLWVRDPDDQVVYFRTKETKVLTLDRDDQGLDGITAPIRREIVSIRGIEPGTYTVNAVLWVRRQNPEKARISVVKLNPYSVVVEKTIELSEPRQEETVINFTLNTAGQVIDKNFDRSPLVEQYFVEDTK